MNGKKIGWVAGLCWLSGLLFVGAPASADFASAMYHYQSENYSSAYKEFIRLAALGHKDSQFNVGAMHFRGQGVEQSSLEAYAWIALSAELGDEFREKLRDRLFNKLSDMDRVAARKRAEELFALYSDKALQEKLTPVYVSNDDCDYELEALEKVAPRYPQAASRIGLSGSVDLEFAVDAQGYVKNYSIISSTNQLFEESVLQAVKKWRYHPFIKDGKPIEIVGVRTRVHFRMPEHEMAGDDLAKYMEALRHKAESGTALDMFTYAYVSDMLPETRMEWEDANRWYFKAAQAGLAHAQYQLGLNLIYGKGCVADPAKGAEWLTRAARSHHAAAQYFLASELTSARHFSPNPDQAQEWLQQATDAKHPDAMLKKAWILATSKDDETRNGQRALELVKEVIDDYADEFTAQQTLAASQAEAGDFSSAQKTQKRVIKLAKSLKRPLEIEEQRLAAYRNKTPWRE